MIKVGIFLENSIRRDKKADRYTDSQRRSLENALQKYRVEI